LAQKDKALALPQSPKLDWVQNKGQWHPELLFRLSQPHFEMQVQANSINYYFVNTQQLHPQFGHHAQRHQEDSALNYHAVQLKFLGAQNAKGKILKAKNYYHNYYQGNNPAKWAHKVPVAAEIALEQIYQGINLHLISKENKLKYEYHLEPNANLKQLQIEVNGANRIYLEYGDLYIETSLETIKESRPIAWQYINGMQHSVQIEYQLKGNIISFIPSANYNPKYSLIIDPEIVFLTYSGTTADNFGCTATYGENGTLYAAGITTDATDIPNGKYPVTAGAFQLNYAGGGISEGELGLSQFPCDITYSKYSSDGLTLLYATYLGGGNNEIPHSLVIDKSNNLLVLGNTYSSNFPVTSSAFDTSHNGRHDIIVSKFSPSGALLASTYLGGNANDGINNNGITNYFFGDSYRGDIISDDNDNIYIISFTQSANFPTTLNAYQDTLKGFQDGAIVKFTPNLSSLSWSTYLGGSGVDAFYSIDFSNSNHILLCGGTNSADFPMKPNAFQSTYGGGSCDGIIVSLANTGANIIDATFYGTDQYDQIISLENDADDIIYVVGQSRGTIPVSAGKFNNPNSHQFISSLNQDLTAKRWSTVFGSGRNQIDLTINAFLVDDCKRIYVSSWGGRTATKIDGSNSSTVGLTVTPDAFQTKTDGSDFYLMLLNKEADGLLYATYLGGNNPDNSGDHVDGGTSRFDKKGVVYQSMCASCPNGGSPFSDLKTYPSNVYAPINLSPRCSNAALKFDFRIENAAFSWEADTCNSIFRFKNETPGTFNFFWQFPDGDTSYAENPEKYIAPEFYGDTIMLIVEFGTNCADTAIGFVVLPDSLSKLDIPNVFTPNGDGINDDFRIGGAIGQCQDAEVWIYNRWGQLVFEDKVSYFRWNGLNQDNYQVPEGVYFYIIRTKKTVETEWQDLHGTVTVIR